MASKTLPELPAVTTIEDADRYYVVRGAGDFYITGASLKAAIGGGGNPQLPSWTWEAGGGTPSGVGKFTTNTSNPNTTTSITFWGTDSIVLFNNVLYDSLLIFTNSAGALSILELESASNDGLGNSVVATSLKVSGATSWGGLYTLSFAAPPLIPVGILKAADGIFLQAVEGTDYARTLAQAQAADSIAPIADGTYSNPASITTAKGIITAIS